MDAGVVGLEHDPVPKVNAVPLPHGRRDQRPPRLIDADMRDIVLSGLMFHDCSTSSYSH